MNLNDSKKITKLLDSFDEIDRHTALIAYGNTDIGDLAFKIELENDNILDNNNIEYHRLNFVKDNISEKTKPLTTSDIKKVLCVATIPSTHNTQGGHAIALVIDNENKTIIYHDPFGKPPPIDIETNITQSFPLYKIETSEIVQQKDFVSCGLITAMNLAAYAKGNDPDPEINNKLWGLRVKHAPHIIKHLINKHKKEDKLKIKNPRNNNSKFKIKVDTGVKHDMIINAFNELNSGNTQITPPYRLFIELAKYSEHNQPDLNKSQSDSLIKATI